MKSQFMDHNFTGNYESILMQYTIDSGNGNCLNETIN